MRTGFERAEMTVSQCGRFLLATLFLLPSLHWDKRKCRLNRSPGSNNRHTSMYDRSRIATAFAVFVVAACASLHGQSSSKQPLDPALAVLGSGFNSDTAQVNGTNSIMCAAGLVLPSSCSTVSPKTGTRIKTVYGRGS
jgi:hypothetical protein